MRQAESRNRWRSIACTALLVQAVYACSIGPAVSARETKLVGGIEFVRIPAGSFYMGMLDCGLSVIEECPRHHVFVSEFWLSKYEITQMQYEVLMGNNPASDKRGDEYPVNNVSWDEAAGFCARFSKRHAVNAALPSEAEWEYACRAGSATEYFWGDEIDGNFCWYYHNSGAKEGKAGLMPVGKKRPNAFGLFDMSGNLWEWCRDWYNAYYYAQSPTKNPPGPKKGELKVLRGGSWKDGGYYQRCGIRNAGGPHIGDAYRGFRVALYER